MKASGGCPSGAGAIWKEGTGTKRALRGGARAMAKERTMDKDGGMRRLRRKVRMEAVRRLGRPCGIGGADAEVGRMVLPSGTS
jgi:hypothetical protein